MKKFVALIKRFINFLAQEIIEINTTKGNISFSFNAKNFMKNYAFT